jgi:CRP/FNR family transcriptional regulator, cyclic AMP receptor protein
VPTLRSNAVRDCRQAGTWATIVSVVDVKTQRRYLEGLRTGRWFAGLPEPFQRGLLDAAVLRTLVVGERLFSRGDPPDGLYATLDGSIRVTGVTDAGKEVLLALAEPPGWFGEIAVFDNAPRTHDAIAHTAATVLRVPKPALEALLGATPTYWRDLGLLLASKLRLTFAALEDAIGLPLAVRLARRLLVTAGAHGEWSDRSRRVVDLRQEQLAAMLGSSRQTINTVLKDLEARGVVRVAYGQIEILDLDGLRRAASTGDT